MTSAAFDAASIERRYAFLDACPEPLLAEVVTLPVGDLPDRVAGIRAWWDALLAGHLPPPGSWPPDEIAAPARSALDELGIARFCKDQPDLVEAVMKDLLAAFAGRAAALQAEVLRRLRELEELERRRLTEEEAAWAQRHKRSPRQITLDAATLARLRAQAEREPARLEAAPDAAIIANWGERARAWAEIAEVLGDLGDLLGRGWDLALGVLRHTGWADLLRLRALVAQLPQLRAIVQSLGRLQVSENDESVADRIMVPLRRLEEERLEVQTPHIPAETRGVERSGEIARMLPSEALMLGHPKLRLLWHARRAERSLLTYRVEGIEIERHLVEREVQEEVERRRPRPERGPILAVIDTSGSMHGLPEQVAKALVLEAVRTAHAEKRRCFLYAYSGPGQVLEQELDLTAEGIGRLLIFLGHSFGGGTDIGAMRAVVERLGQATWKKADVLLVSDGEWAAPADVVAAVTRAKKERTRFHGVQIGNRGQTGMHALCDPVHVFADWAAAGGWMQRG